MTSPSAILEQLVAALGSGTIRVIDLTAPLTPDTPTLVLPSEYSQTAGFELEELSRYDERGPDWYWNNFRMGEHTGTHLDAPVHWVTGKDLPNNTVDRLAVEGFVSRAVVIDLSEKARVDADFLFSLDDIERWEDIHGQIPTRSWVLLRTDWSKREGDAYVNRRQDGPHTPGPTAEAVRFLIEEREIFGLGTETIGTDAGQAHTMEPQYPAHHFLHGAGLCGLQCLTNLDLLPATGAVVVAAPLKIVGGSGSPLRAIALVSG